MKNFLLGNEKTAIKTGTVTFSNHKIVKVTIFSTKAEVHCLRKDRDDSYSIGDQVLVARNDKGSYYIVDSYIDNALHPKRATMSDI